MNFKNYINEAFKISELMSMGAIPLSVGMMDRLGYSEQEKVVYHLCNAKNLPARFKQQNKEYHLSTFSKGSKKLSGLPSHPNVLLKLRGLSLIEADVDIYTEPSDKKRRWITSHDSKLQKHMEGILMSALQENDINIDFKKGITFRTVREEIMKSLENTGVKVYKSYIKKTEEWLNSGGYKVLNDYLKSASGVSYNEIILTRWTILEIQDINTKQAVTVDFCNKHKITYSGVTTWREIAGIS